MSDTQAAPTPSSEEPIEAVAKRYAHDHLLSARIYEVAFKRDMRAQMATDIKRLARRVLGEGANE